MKLTLIFAAALLVLSSTAQSQTMPGEALPLMDGNGDGVVTEQEFTNGMTTLFGGMDTNQNGRLDRAETESFISNDLFSGADTNSDGTLSKSEYDAQILKDFEAADEDGDSDLD